MLFIVSNLVTQENLVTILLCVLLQMIPNLPLGHAFRKGFAHQQLLGGHKHAF